jgi:AcrR family transcriptional regulator
MPKLTNQEKVLTALINTSSIRDAAKASGIGEATIYRYLADEKFLTEYQAAQNEIVGAAVAALKHAATEAVETLRRNLTCDNPQAEIRAAQIILDNVLGNESDKSQNREIVISFNFNNQTVRLTND